MAGGQITLSIVHTSWVLKHLWFWKGVLCQYCAVCIMYCDGSLQHLSTELSWAFWYKNTLRAYPLCTFLVLKWIEFPGLRSRSSRLGESPPECAKLSLWQSNKTNTILSLLSLKRTQHQDPPFPTHKPLKVSGLSVLFLSHAEWVVPSDLEYNKRLFFPFLSCTFKLLSSSFLCLNITVPFHCQFHCT